MHGARGEVVVATVAHHLQQHNGNWNIFCSSPLQSLCESCHNSVAQSLEKGGRGEMIGLDGWPIRNDFQKWNQQWWRRGAPGGGTKDLRDDSRHRRREPGIL